MREENTDQPHPNRARLQQQLHARLCHLGRSVVPARNTLPPHAPHQACRRQRRSPERAPRLAQPVPAQGRRADEGDEAGAASRDERRQRTPAEQPAGVGSEGGAEGKDAEPAVRAVRPEPPVHSRRV